MHGVSKEVSKLVSKYVYRSIIISCNEQRRPLYTHVLSQWEC